MKRFLALLLMVFMLLAILIACVEEEITEYDNNQIEESKNESNSNLESDSKRESDDEAKIETNNDSDTESEADEGESRTEAEKKSETEKKPSEGLKFELSEDGKSYSVVGIGTCLDTSIVIPDIYKGLPVKSIEKKAFSDCSDITSVELSDSIKTVGDSAFSNCYGLTSVTIGKSVAVLERNAFKNCVRIKKVNINDIASWCNVTFGNDNARPGSNLYLKNASGEYEILENLVIPEGVTNIGEMTFMRCKSFKLLQIPSSVENIDKTAFLSCTGIERIIVDENNAKYSTIDGNLYTKDGKILLLYAMGKTADSFTLPDCVEIISEEAFYGCTNLKNVYTNNIKNISERAFKYCVGLENVTISNIVTSIGGGAFYGCTGLVNVYYEGDVTAWLDIEFYDNPLYYAKNLYLKNSSGEYELVRDLIIPDSVTSIGNRAFCGYEGLMSVTIPNSVTRIGWYAFYECTGLTSVTIPNSITRICEYSFYGCTGLTSVTFENPNGWLYTIDSSITSGTEIPSSVFADTAKAAEYLKSGDNYYCKCS